jgi:hypothetical protein
VPAHGRDTWARRPDVHDPDRAGAADKREEATNAAMPFVAVAAGEAHL